MNPYYITLLYTINTIICGTYWWLQYLDISTTMKDVARGAVESNPAMVHYVKVGDPWLMFRGKIKNGAWAGFIAFYFHH